MPALRVDPERVAVLVIDAQPAFWDAMAGAQEPVLARIVQLLLLAGRYRLPCLATFEHPTAVKGWFPEPLERVFPAGGGRFVKRAFDCCAEEEIRDHLHKLPVEQVAVAGAETDVCVLQSVLGLRAMGYEVFLLEDCLFTSEPHPRPALERMYQAGAVPSTYKTFSYEVVRVVGADPSPAGGTKAGAAAAPGFVAPERLPPWEPAR